MLLTTAQCSMALHSYRKPVTMEESDLPQNIEDLELNLDFFESLPQLPGAFPSTENITQDTDNYSQIALGQLRSFRFSHSEALSGARLRENRRHINQYHSHSRRRGPPRHPRSIMLRRLNVMNPPEA